MKLLAPLLLASAALLSTVMALDLFAGSVSVVESTVDSAEVMVWPGSAGAHRLRRSEGISNAERLRRGLGPSRPRNLYQAKVEDGLAKRIIAPAQAQASGSARIYNFEACYSASVFGSATSQFFSLTYTSPADLANQCAAKQDAQSGAGDQKFFIADRTDNNCVTAVTSNTNTGTTTCAPGDANQGAVYMPA